MILIDVRENYVKHIHVPQYIRCYVRNSSVIIIKCQMSFVSEYVKIAFPIISSHNITRGLKEERERELIYIGRRSSIFAYKKDISEISKILQTNLNTCKKF